MQQVLDYSYRINLAMVHYAFIGTKSKRDIAKSYNINLNTFKLYWSKSGYDKK